MVDVSASRQIPLDYQLRMLPFKAVFIRVLDADRRATNVASGVVVQEADDLYLYTCWHVVTGFSSPHELRIPRVPPCRRYLEVFLQGVSRPQKGIESIGGCQALTLPLYDGDSADAKPLWQQDKMDQPNGDVNMLGLKVPFWHDAIRLKLPRSLELSDCQIVSADDLFRSPITLPYPSELAYVVGYPYGFSTQELRQPTPVVLPRFIAATDVYNRRNELLIDGIGAEGMSGGPVFVERAGQLKLLGLYTGLIYPDHSRPVQEKATALGTCVNMIMCWEHPHRFGGADASAE